jgi:oligoribonuclease
MGLSKPFPPRERMLASRLMPAPNDAPKRRQDARNRAWLDLEMTGLDANCDTILQAALIITDGELNPLEELTLDIWQPAAEVEKMSPFVRDMHTRTGLIERVRQSLVDVGKAEQRLLEVVAGWCPYGAVLCGNSIWQDRKFLDKWMPGLSRYLTYRMLDVSAIKLLAKQWYGETAVFVKNPSGEHDALVDVRNSIAELRHYRARLFVPNE